MRTHLTICLLGLAVVAGSWTGCYFNREMMNLDQDKDGFNDGADCNDEDSSIYPGAAEICGDGVDNDCDGKIDSLDPECDGGSGGTGGTTSSGGGQGGTTSTGGGGQGGTTSSSGGGQGGTPAMGGSGGTPAAGGSGGSGGGN